MKDSSKMEIGKVKVNIHGQIKVIIKENGYVIKWMEKVYTLILKLNFKDTFKMITLFDH